MGEKGNYKTKHKAQMQEYLENRGSVHFTAADVSGYFLSKGTPMGKTTVYRQLEELLAEGRIKKYVIDENSSACYEYLGAGCERPDAYHLKCEKCGRLIHLECDEITAFEEHIAEHHRFKVDRGRTVFYGICEECLSDRKG